MDAALADAACCDSWAPQLWPRGEEEQRAAKKNSAGKNCATEEVAARSD
jgi:hypothetical protein